MFGHPGVSKLGAMALNQQQNAANRQAYGNIMQNPQAFASWFGQQSPQMQQGLLSPGGGGMQTPWGTLGAEGRTMAALQAGGLNGNTLNQFANNTDANVGYNGGIAAGRNPATIWDFTSGGPYYGGSTAAGAGQGGPGIAGWSGSDAYNAAHPYDPNAWTGQGGGGQQGVMPQGTAANEGGFAGPGGVGSPIGVGSGTAQPNALGSIPNQNAPNYPLNVGAYINPMAQYAQDWANKGLQGTYAGAGDLLSGSSMRGIADYNQNMALNNAYLPALQAAQQQQQFGYGVNSADRNFAFQQQLANQTIPFSQQMQLAQLGLQGTQGAQGVTNLNATLQAQLAQALGNAQGAGTIGAGNQLTGGLGGALNQWLANQYLNRILPTQSGTGTGGG